MTEPNAGLVAPLVGLDSPLRLLLIEDSASDSDLVLALLEVGLPKAQIDVAANLQEALLRLDHGHFDLALADLSLPDAEGLAVVHAVRAAHPETALLVLTGRVDGELALWALAEGAQDYLVKGQHDGPRLATALLHALQRQRSEREANKYLQLARGLLDALEAPTCAVDAEGRIVAFNEAWEAFTLRGDESTSAWGLGVNYLNACAEEAAADTTFSDTARAHAHGLQDVLSSVQERYQQEHLRPSQNGQQWFSVRIAPALIEGRRGAVISHVDVTEMHRVLQELSHQSLHDSLTGLPNRLLLADRLTQALADGHRRNAQVGVGFLDLDHFKRINDSLGHAAGDALLVQVAHRLAAQMRPADTLSRYSGDEFVVIWRDLDSAEAARLFSERLASAFDEPFVLTDSLVTITASIGVVVGHSLESADDLLMAADAAMYDAKRHGGGRVRMFSDALRLDAQRLNATEGGLRAALHRSELVLHYQPVVDLETGTAIAVEALVRWQHPERGLLGPGEFIPVAESSGLIVELGRWVLNQACHDGALFRGAAQGLDVAVNLSVRQLIHPDIVAHVQDALAASGLDPRRLLLEVTESAVMEDEGAAAAALDALAALGVRIAIDDFGTGYSSLLYLRRFPISALKLDRTFVSGIGLHLNDEAICSNVVSLASAVGATSIAEGVETQEQYEALCAYGCQQGQGFLWSPAVPVDELAGVIARAAIRVPPPRLSKTTQGSRLPVLDTVIGDQLTKLFRAGSSLHTIAAAMNRSGAPNPSGNRWSASAVQRHLVAISVRRQGQVVAEPCRLGHLGAATRLDLPDPPAKLSRLPLAVVVDRNPSIHLAHLYGEGKDLFTHAASYLAKAMADGFPCIVIATEAHRISLRQGLTSTGFEASLESPLYLERDATQLLESFMRDGHPVPELFEEALLHLLVRGEGAGGSPHIFAETGDLLWSSGNVIGAVELEDLWEALGQHSDFTLQCVYSLEDVWKQSRESIDAVFRQHRHVSGL